MLDNLEKITDFKFGENSHQGASLYKSDAMIDYEVVNGGELSYKNILDMTTLIQILSEFYDVNATIMVKNAMPCGAALGTSLTDAFNKAFEASLKRSFTDKLHLYKDETIKVLGGEKIKNNRYNLKTSIILDGKINYIIFKFRELNGDWKIYDVDVLGISVIQTYRSQFADIIDQQGFEALLKKLESEIIFEN